MWNEEAKQEENAHQLHMHATLRLFLCFCIEFFAAETWTHCN